MQSLKAQRARVQRELSNESPRAVRSIARLEHRCRLVDEEREFIVRNPEMLVLTNLSKRQSRSRLVTPMPTGHAPLDGNATPAVVSSMRKANRAETVAVRCVSLFVVLAVFHFVAHLIRTWRTAKRKMNSLAAFIVVHASLRRLHRHRPRRPSARRTNAVALR